MRILSAVEAISPALNRTRRILFQPFRWRTFLKLCAVAVFTEGLFSSFRANRGSGVPHQAVPSQMLFSLPPHWVGLLIAMMVVALAVGCALLYLASRLRFALFDCLIHQTTRIRTGWRLYHDQAFRFFVFNIAVGLAFVALILAILFPFAAHVIQVLRQQPNPPPSVVFSVLMPLIPIILFLILAGVATDMVLRDFMLPHFALENATVSEAWSAVWDRLTTDTGAFLLYGVLRIVLPFLAFIGLFIVLALPMLLLFGGPALLMAALHAAMAQASPAAGAAFLCLEVLVGLVMGAIALLVGIVVGGPLCIAIRNYALVFYGGRYQALGNILFPPPPVSPA